MASPGKLAHRCHEGMEPEDCFREQYDRLGFIHLPSIDDGNCLYYTISHWMQLTGHPYAAKTHKQLRDMVVEHMKERNEEDSNVFGAFFLNNDYPSAAAKKADIKREILKLGKDGVWDSPISDHVPLMAAETFDLHIHLYNWDWATKSFTIYDINPTGSSEISILRINNNHFELFFPKGDFTNNAQAAWSVIEASNQAAINTERATLRTKYEKRLGREINNNEFTGMILLNREGELNNYIKADKKARKAAAPKKTRRGRAKARSKSRSPNTKNQARFTNMLGRPVTRNELPTLRMLEEENMLINSLRASNNLNKSMKKAAKTRKGRK